MSRGWRSLTFCREALWLLMCAPSCSWCLLPPIRCFIVQEVRIIHGAVVVAILDRFLQYLQLILQPPTLITFALCSESGCDITKGK